MSMGASRDSLGRLRARREPIDVAEKRPEDKRLDKLMGVRRQRLDRLERERLDARQTWRDSRARLHQAKRGWRAALQEAQQYWRQARSSFFQMAITSGKFRQSKAAYDRMKQSASLQRLAACQLATSCKDDGRAFFAAHQVLADARRQQEKLTILRDELRASGKPVEE
ncbi:hypothetical protein BCF11_2733 [Collimonas sp. PA-H2]|uniref:hypothetical protein n=1 Tax=Collimonas sp. PA-H2 TaxID=1881062 RepID=UPI000C001540|nr:hypothetical protein [Collimonas sp. PA-H2]PFH10315.1 hypothetical protein BCF11_2733 [Collimonas sp. PA-H2]